MADEDLSDLFGEYGMVESINLIPPRGCAFVHMNRRMDAYKALKELHKHKLHGKPITVSPEKFRIYSPTLRFLLRAVRRLRKHIPQNAYFCSLIYCLHIYT